MQIHDLPFFADGSLHMYLFQVLWSGFVPGFQTWLQTAESPMSLYLNSSFIGEDGIWEAISVLSCPFQSLKLIDIMYHLTVSTTMACPPKFCSTFQCSGFTYMMAVQLRPQFAATSPAVRSNFTCSSQQLHPQFTAALPTVHSNFACSSQQLCPQFMKYEHCMEAYFPCLLYTLLFFIQSCTV